MIYYFIELVNVIVSSCCSKRKETKLIDRLKQDVKQLRRDELELLKSFMIRPLRDKTYCC